MQHRRITEEIEGRVIRPVWCVHRHKSGRHVMMGRVWDIPDGKKVARQVAMQHSGSGMVVAIVSIHDWLLIVGTHVGSRHDRMGSRSHCRMAGCCASLQVNWARKASTFHVGAVVTEASLDGAVPMVLDGVVCASW